jgi:UPF0755 protein
LTIIAAVIALIGVGGYLAWAWNHPTPIAVQAHVVEPGTSMYGFAHELHDKGLLPETYSLILLAYVRGDARNLKAGEYNFEQGITPRQLLDQVVAGRVIEYPLALIEGWTFDQFLEAIRNARKVTRTLDGLSHAEIMARLGQPELHPEGQFYPDTYNYSAGTTDLSLLHRAFERMQSRLQREWIARVSDLPLQTPYEALILASIVEKETGHADERELIAGVFIMYATMHPAPTKALYFVSRGDGSHHFSETLQEHNNAVIKYQLRGKPQSFSSYSVKN